MLYSLFLLLPVAISAHWCTRKHNGVDRGRDVCPVTCKICSSIVFHFGQYPKIGEDMWEGCDVTQDCINGIHSFMRNISRDEYERRFEDSWPLIDDTHVAITGNCTPANDGHDPWAINTGAREGYALIMLLTVWMVFYLCSRTGEQVHVVDWSAIKKTI